MNANSLFKIGTLRTLNTTIIVSPFSTKSIDFHKLASSINKYIIWVAACTFTFTIVSLTIWSDLSTNSIFIEIVSRRAFTTFSMMPLMTCWINIMTTITILFCFKRWITLLTVSIIKKNFAIWINFSAYSSSI